nr:deoxyribonuclease V [Xanthomonas albilineans]
MQMSGNSAVFGDWDGSIAQARAMQTTLARQVRLHDEVTDPPRWLAGVDVGFEDEGRITRAAAVLLDAHTLQPRQTEIARVPTTMAYIPGLLSFRELPALLAALALLRQRPDLVFVDGQGIAHPRRLGIAAHFGVVTGLPSIGVAKKSLAGHFDAPGAQAGDCSPILHRGEVVGWALRSKARCNPLIVSPGHRVSVDSALHWTQRYLRGYRLPEPTRLADRLASRRGEVAVHTSAIGNLF